MANTMTALTTAVSGDALWTEFGNTIPFLGPVILFAFGFGIVAAAIRFITKKKNKSVA